MLPPESTAQDPAHRPPFGSRRFAWLVLGLALTPAVLSVWLSPVFVTQDGPAHLYNAHILNESLGSKSPFRDVFTVRWSPLPNWLGHLMEMALVATLPPLTADRIANSIPLIGLAVSTFWLKGRVGGTRGDVSAAVFSALIAMNVAWLFGFTSFLLGACLFPITLGIWWVGREGLTVARAGSIAGLLILGYFSHVVSLGLTAMGLLVLAAFTPCDKPARRMAFTITSLSPLAVLLPIYRGMMGAGGPLRPAWAHFQNPMSLSSWREQAGWVDPISLGRKGALPFLSGESNWLGLVSPAALMIAAVAVLTIAGGLRVTRANRGWAILSAILILGGFFAPDPQGETHGNYVPQRIVLLGLVSLAAWIDFAPRRLAGRIAIGLLSASVIVQSLLVIDYARETSKRVSPFARARLAIGREKRIGTLLLGIETRFRSNSVRHADCLLGVGTGNVVWSDYETIHYYFPVQFRPEVDRPPARDLEEIAIQSDPADSADRARRWADLLERHHASIDLLAVWGRDPKLEAISGRWFASEPIYMDGPLRIFAKTPEAR